MTTPYQQADALDYIVLGTAVSPGVVTLKGHDRWKNWDIQKAKGSSGASSSLEGDPIGKFEATFHLAGDSLTDPQLNDFEAWESFRRLIESMTSGPKPIALPVYHPDLAANGFTEVSSGGIGAPVYPGDGSKKITVRFVEYKPPKPKTSSRAKAKPGLGSARKGVQAPPDPNAAAKRELAGLLDQARQP